MTKTNKTKKKSNTKLKFENNDSVLRLESSLEQILDDTINKKNGKNNKKVERDKDAPTMFTDKQVEIINYGEDDDVKLVVEEMIKVAYDKKHTKNETGDGMVYIYKILTSNYGLEKAKEIVLAILTKNNLL